jgi:hypothetical protein
MLETVNVDGDLQRQISDTLVDLKDRKISDTIVDLKYRSVIH